MPFKSEHDRTIAVNQLENCVAVLLGSLRSYERKAPLTPPLANLRDGLQNALDNYRMSKKELRNPKV